MKKVITYNPNDNTIMGIISSLKVVDDNLIIWDTKNKPIYDMIDEIKPELMFLDSQQITPIILEALNNNKDIKVVLFGLSYYQQINPTLILLNDDISKSVMTQFQKNGCPYYIIKKAANIAQYTNGQVIDSYFSDILYLSVDNPQQNPHILEILISLSKQKYRLKICGQYPILLSSYLGRTTIKDMTNLMLSTKIGIDFDGSMLYNYIANGVFCISSVKNEYMPCFNHRGSLEDTLAHFLNDQSLRDDWTIPAQKKVLSEHTYFHRLKDILQILELNDLADKCDK